MSVTKQEILVQYEALEQSLREMERQKDAIRAFFGSIHYDSITFIGCGSSFSLAKSASAIANLHLDVPAFAMSAGDLFVNGGRYAAKMKHTLIVTLSRSGSTSEILLALNKIQKLNNTPCLSICERIGSDVAKLAGLSIELPWAFDESVCQTRSVTNLYFAVVMLIAILSENKSLADSLTAMIGCGQEYIDNTVEMLEKIAGLDWNKVVVLADGELEGIAEEGALAFKEISLLQSNYYHVLDVRHGPIVLIDKQTLVIAALSPDEEAYQSSLIGDLKRQEATVVGMCGGGCAADYCIRVPARGDFAAYGIPFIFIPQMLSCLKAEALGINPDIPNGLEPCIIL